MDKKEYLLHLFIINRSGSLIYNKQFDETRTPKIDPNDALMFSGTFHALHTISAHSIPPPQSNLDEINQTSGQNSQNTGQNNQGTQQQQQYTKAHQSNAQTGQTSSSSSLTPLQQHQQSQLQQHNQTLSNTPTFNNPESLTTILHPERLPIQQTLGISVIETKKFLINNLQTPTGLKIILITTPNYPDINTYLRNINVLYVDYVLKNPFQEIGMPIRSELFEKFLTKLLVPSVTLK